MGEVRLGAAAGQHRLLKDLHRLAQGRRAPAGELRLDAGLAPEMQAAPARHQQARALVRPLQPARQQLQGMPQGGAQHHRGVEPLVAEAAIVALDLPGPSGEGRIDQRGEHARRHVAHHRLDIVETDAAAVLGIEGELLDLREAGAPVAAEALAQHLAGLARDAQAVLLQRPVDQLAERALVVRVAGDRECLRRALAQGAQGGGFREVARLHHDARARDLDLQHGLDGGRVVAAAGPDPDRALVAEQADRAGLVHQSSRIAGQHVAVDLRQREGIARIRHEALGEALGPLGDEPGIGPVDEDDGDPRVGAAADQAFRLMRLDGGHAPCPTAGPRGPRRYGS
ncbi:hypothetical protein IFDJLNFL_4916 [Methylobacterium dankookense]|uniref:Uncharacterized protein n=1 Tax=Methylobacterium dankookense TaxID=560405 RepID=A0ABQ4RQE1_9HYPH|nr:hypothetical protein IFDJLNFL_4916 [Methylobacterium dankookense]